MDIGDTKALQLAIMIIALNWRPAEYPSADEIPIQDTIILWETNTRVSSVPNTEIDLFLESKSQTLSSRGPLTPNPGKYYQCSAGAVSIVFVASTEFGTRRLRVRG